MARKKRKVRKARVMFTLILMGLLIGGVVKILASISGDFKSSAKVIVIDAGHGGTDPGTTSISGHYEKDINLAIAQKLEDKLKAKGYKVISTRNTDDYVENLERAELANKKRARVFVSIHGNALENDSTTKGIQVLYYPGRSSTIGDPGSNELAQIMMNSLIGGIGAMDKGIKEREELVVLNQTKMPAIIVEYGFLSSESEEKLLVTEGYQEKIVESVVEGLEAYFSLNTKI